MFQVFRVKTADYSPWRMERGRRQCGQAKCQQAAGRCSCPELQRPATAAPCYSSALQSAATGRYCRSLLPHNPAAGTLHSGATLLHGSNAEGHAAVFQDSCIMVQLQ